MQAKGAAESQRYVKLVDTYKDLKNNNLGWTNSKDKLFYHWLLAFKLSKGTRTLYFKNPSDLSSLN